MNTESDTSLAQVSPLSAEDRFELGRSLRKKTPREMHADWSIAEDRADPVKLVEEQNIDRISWLVPERRSRMAESVFKFYRATARIMAHDLSTTPVSGIQVQLSGDAHVGNFGAYGSPERNLVFDLNDFDETLPGPWEWDVKRLAASCVLAGRHNGFKKKQTRKITEICVSAYRKYMRLLSKRRLTDIWYDLFDAEDIYRTATRPKAKKSYKKTIEKARQKDHFHALDRLTESNGNRHRIKSEPPFLVPLSDIKDHNERDSFHSMVMDSYERYLENLPDHVAHLLGNYQPVDYAVKVVGVGSVGTMCSIMMLEGRNRKDPFFLQIKEAKPSVLEEFLGKSKYESSAQRIIEGQRLLQTVSDIFLGWTYNEKMDRHFYWRQLKDWKGSGDVENANIAEMESYAVLRGKTLARAHARSGDPIAIAGYLGKSNKFDKALTVFGEKYADQMEQDFAAFVEFSRNL